MVRVNGKKFKIYELDGLDSFKDRLASNMKTLESFLYFPNGVTNTDIWNEKSNIIVENLLAEIKNSSSEPSSLIQLINDIQTKVGKIKYDKGKDIVKLWLVYNKNFVKKQGNEFLNNIGDELKKSKVYISSNQISIDWRETDTFENFFEYRIVSNTNRVNDNLKILKEYEDIDESSAYTEFVVEHIEYILTLNLNNLSLMELFNFIHLNSTVPFATTNNFYKIRKDFIPPSEWVNSDKNSLIIQVYQKNYTSTSLRRGAIVSNYETSLIEINPTTNHVTAKININPHENNINKDEFTNRIFSVFKGLDINIKTFSESGVKGVFYFPSLRLNKYVFNDLILNDEIFSRLISVDEHDKATTKKSGIHIHFEHPSTGYITATITEKILIKGDQTMKNVDLDYFEKGEPFIRVKISKANNEKSIKIFQEILGKLFILYEKKKSKIIDFYKNYIPSFGDVAPPDKDVVKKVKKHSETVPSLFVPGYTKMCNKQERMTTIVTSEEEANKFISEGKRILKFPRDIPDDPKALKFPKDGEDQQYYVCNDPKYKYPGIMHNKLKNANIYPYVPCCFEKPQENKDKYLHYYKGKELVAEKIKHNIIITDKILKHDQFGTLPQNIKNLFTILDPDPKFEYVRKGVYNNKNSFINVVMEALNEETSILDIDCEIARADALTEERLLLARKNIVPLCRQELYDLNTNEIIDLIKDPEVYFDPKLFIHLLEDRFDCNIYLFTREVMDGEMTLPRHLQAYYKNYNKRRSIYVYEHMGSEYPQCELIIKYNTKKGKNNSQYSFTYNESKNIRNVYSRLRKSYALNNIINETIIPPFHSSVKIYTQFIDSYGKTRILNIMYKNKKISLIISPIQPIKVLETTKSEIFLTDIKSAMELVEILQIKVKSQTIIGNVNKELNGYMGNIFVSIPIENGYKIDGIQEKQHGLSFPEKHISLLDKYNNNKKLARYLVEYTLWMYSTYLHENGIVNITDKNISQFAEKLFIIKPDYIYKHIEKLFNKNSSIIYGGKIVVHNKETIKRLMYVLRLSIQRNIDNVRKYHEYKIIQNYYVDITDFDKYNEQVILFGEESVDKWITDNNIVYNIHNEVQIGINTPYFFKNTLIDTNIYLAQNTQTLDKATDIAVTWVRKGYNVGIYATNMTPVTFTLYSYINENTIRKGMKIKGKPFSEEVKIIGYKIDNKAEYTVLLSLK